MEWSIPLQKLDVTKIHPCPLQKSQKPLTPLSYIDGPIHMQQVNILLPPLIIKEYDLQTGRLILQVNSDSLLKLTSLQDTLLGIVCKNQGSWFQNQPKTKEELKSLFQPFLENGFLYLYCPLQTQERKYIINIWKDGIWNPLYMPGDLRKGQTIRVGIRVQGISYQTNTASGVWTGRFRLQHRLYCILIKPSEEQKCLLP